MYGRDPLAATPIQANVSMALMIDPVGYILRARLQ